MGMIAVNNQNRKFYFVFLQLQEPLVVGSATAMAAALQSTLPPPPSVPRIAVSDAEVAPEEVQPSSTDILPTVEKFRSRPSSACSEAK